MLCMMFSYVLLFFIKQKTAYEMRISDWSSDVCSSDLIYKSPSAAGSAVMGGTACNGWRFWSLEGEEAAPKERAPKAPNEPRAARPKPARGTPAAPTIDRKSVLKGNSVQVRVELGGRRIVKKTITQNRLERT